MSIVKDAAQTVEDALQSLNHRLTKLERTLADDAKCTEAEWRQVVLADISDKTKDFVRGCIARDSNCFVPAEMIREIWEAATGET